MDSPLLFGVALSILGASVVLFFAGLKLAQNGVVVIYADAWDARIGSIVTVAVGALPWAVYYLADEYPGGALVVLGLLSWPLFWFIYRAAVYNPQWGRFCLALLLRVNTVFLQISAFLLLLLVQVMQASSKKERLDRGEHVSETVETAKSAASIAIFMLMFVALEKSSVHEERPKYVGVRVPAALQLCALALWVAALYGILTPVAPPAWNAKLASIVFFWRDAPPVVAAPRATPDKRQLLQNGKYRESVAPTPLPQEAANTVAAAPSATREVADLPTSASVTSAFDGPWSGTLRCDKGMSSTAHMHIAAGEATVAWANGDFKEELSGQVVDKGALELEGTGSVNNDPMRGWRMQGTGYFTKNQFIAKTRSAAFDGGDGFRDCRLSMTKAG